MYNMIILHPHVFIVCVGVCIFVSFHFHSILFQDLRELWLRKEFQWKYVAAHIY